MFGAFSITETIVNLLFLTLLAVCLLIAQLFRRFREITQPDKYLFNFHSDNRTAFIRGRTRLSRAHVTRARACVRTYVPHIRKQMRETAQIYRRNRGSWENRDANRSDH